MIYKSCLGTEYEVRPYFSKYISNDSIALVLVGEGEYKGQRIATLTVNLDGTPPKGCAYLDTNNCEDAERFVIENGLAEPMNIYKRSGYCEYPLYRFNTELVKRFKDLNFPLNRPEFRF